MKELNDEEIREKLIDSKRWENKLVTNKDSKTKLKKDLINLDFNKENEKVESLEKETNNVFVRWKIEKLTVVNKKMSRYLSL